MMVTQRFLLSASLFVALLIPTSADAASASGSFQMQRAPGVLTPAANVKWTIGGTLLAARSEAPRVGVAVTPGLTNTDSRYVSGMLTGASQAAVTKDCADGLNMGNTSTQSIDGVANAATAFETNLTLNYLTGHGTAEVDIAGTPYQGAYGKYFAPGMSTYTFHSTCYGQVIDSASPVATIGNDSVTIFDDFTGQRVARLAWPLTYSKRSWHLSSVQRFTINGESDTISAHVLFSGTGTSMHALCYLPTVRNLRNANTFMQAKSITARAGFTSVTTSSAHTAAAIAGHFFIAEEIGNDNPGLCGSRRLHLVRSLGR